MRSRIIISACLPALMDPVRCSRPMALAPSMMLDSGQWVTLADPLRIWVPRWKGH